LTINELRLVLHVIELTDVRPGPAPSTDSQLTDVELMPA
jgi:hypothetical protein